MYSPSDNSSDGTECYQNYHHGTDSHDSEPSKHPKTSKLRNAQIRKSYPFMQVIPTILSNGPLSEEINAFLECRSVTTLLRKNIANILNLEVSQQQLAVTSVLSKSDKVNSAIIQLISFEKFLKAITVACERSRYTF